jgi:hypothetical protein
MRHLKSIVIVIVVALLTILVGSSNALAESSSSNAAQGLQISPTRIEINKINPGESRSITVTLTNVTSSELQYSTKFADFTAADESGSPKLSEDSSLENSISIKKWFSGLPDDFILASHEIRQLTAVVNVPKDAEIGGHYGAILFPGSQPEMDKTGVGLSASTGVLILIRVGDDSQVNEEANLEGYFSANGERQSSLFEYSPVDFVVRIKNTGNVHIKPSGNIEIKDTFGNVVTTLPVNEVGSNVLPNSVRKFTAKVSKPWMFGLYTANLTMGYGTKGQAITGTTSFWVIPYRLIGGVLLGLVTIVFIFKRMLRAYNRRIIEKAKEEIHGKNKKETGKNS